MRFIGVIAAALAVGMLSSGCGWSPPSATPTTAVACTPAEGPSADSVADQVNRLPAAPWRETARGHSADCVLHWVVVTAGDAPDSPQQVIFFDRTSPIGTPTPDPRPYIAVTAAGDATATVQYQWRQGQDAACCPTGIGTVRFTIEGGALKALDPIPPM